MTSLADISYIFLGCSRQRDATAAAKAFEIEAGNRLGQGRGGLLTPSSPFSQSPFQSPELKLTAIPELTIGPAAIERANASPEAEGYTQTLFEAGAPLSPFHYQLRKAWRVPYLEEKVHQQFRTHIYGWVSSRVGPTADSRPGRTPRSTFSVSA